MLPPPRKQPFRACCGCFTPDYRLTSSCGLPMVAHARLSDAQYSLLPSAPASNRKTPQTVDLQLVPPLVLPEAPEAVRDLRASLQPNIAARIRSGSELLH